MPIPLLPILVAEGIIWIILKKIESRIPKPTTPDLLSELRHRMADAQAKKDEPIDWDLFFLWHQQGIEVDDVEMRRKFEEAALYDHFPGTIRSDDEDLQEQTKYLSLTQPLKKKWCDGYALEPLNPDDLNYFQDSIVKTAYTDQEYNGLPLDDGGLDRMYLDWFVMKGASEDGAKMLYNSGVMPWEWKGADEL